MSNAHQGVRLIMKLCTPYRTTFAMVDMGGFIFSYVYLSVRPGHSQDKAKKSIVCVQFSRVAFM